jgi:glycosyltransferase involved in cell wall biosynthesis
MKIVFIIPSITNFHTFLSEITDRLLKDKHEVYLFAGNKPIVKGQSPYPENISCNWIKIDFPRSFQPKKHFFAAREIDKNIQKINPDLIHVHFSAAMFTVSLAKKANWPPVIATIHGLAWPTRKKSTQLLLKRAELNAARKMDRVIVLNKDDLVLLKENGIKNVTILFDYGIGCNTDVFQPKTIDNTIVKSLKSKFKIKKGDTVFIFIGRQTSFKGFNKVIRAFMRIYHAKAPYHLLLIGDKDFIHESGLNQIEEELISHIPSIHQIGWIANIENFLAIADINVFPSIREGLPVNLMESLSMGVPVITINSRGCNEIVQDNENGLVLKKNNVTNLATAMKQLSNNFVLLNRFKANGLNKRDEYDRRKYISLQLEFYTEYLQNRVET